jgi:hypothetical protein
MKSFSLFVASFLLGVVAYGLFVPNSPDRKPSDQHPNSDGLFIVRIKKGQSKYFNRIFDQARIKEDTSSVAGDPDEFYYGMSHYANRKKYIIAKADSVGLFSVLAREIDTSIYYINITNPNPNHLGFLVFVRPPISHFYQYLFYEITDYTLQLYCNIDYDSLNRENNVFSFVANLRYPTE